METKLGQEPLLAEPSPWCRSVRGFAYALLGLSAGALLLSYGREVSVSTDVDDEAAVLALYARQHTLSSKAPRGQESVQGIRSSHVSSNPIYKNYIAASSSSRATALRAEIATGSTPTAETLTGFQAAYQAPARQFVQGYLKRIASDTESATGSKPKAETLTESEAARQASARRFVQGYLQRTASHPQSEEKEKISSSGFSGIDVAAAEKIKEWERKMVVDEDAKLAESTFPIKPEELIMKAKLFLASDMGVSGPDLLSLDFEFVGPVVGPLSGDTYLKAVGGFKLQDSFPDFNSEFHHFRVDPFEPSRVWFTARGYGTNTGNGDSPLFGEPTGKKYINPPQACSLRFDRDGKVNQYTIGYVMDRRIGNTGGLGGVYGLAYAMGKPLPFPEAQPWKPSKRYRFFNWLGSLLQNRQTKESA